MSNVLHPTVESYNAQIVHTPGISTTILPKLFAVWQISHSNHTCDSSCTYKAVLILATPITHNPLIYTFSMLHTLEPVLQNAVCIKESHDTWLQSTSHKVLIERPSSILEEHKRLYESNISFDKYVLQLSSSLRIPVFTMPNKNTVLEIRFVKLDHKYNIPFSMIMKPGLPITFPEIADYVKEYYRTENKLSLQTYYNTLSIKPSTYIPTHILDAYIDTLIAKKEVCPITFEELTHDTICITPCGHVASISAAEQWFRNNSNCHVCRTSCSLHSLQRFSLT